MKKLLITIITTLLSWNLAYGANSSNTVICPSIEGSNSTNVFVPVGSLSLIIQARTLTGIWRQEILPASGVQATEMPDAGSRVADDIFKVDPGTYDSSSNTCNYSFAIDPSQAAAYIKFWPGLSKGIFSLSLEP